MHPGPRDVCAIAFVSGAGAWCPRDSKWGRLCEGPQGTRGEVHAEPRQKIVPAGWARKGTRGPGSGVIYFWKGAHGRGGVAFAVLIMGGDFVRVFGAPGGRRVQSPPKNSTCRSRGQRPQGRRSGRAIALVGATRGGLRGTRNGARLCEGPRSTQGETRTEVQPKIVPAGRGVKVTRGVDTVGYSPGQGAARGGVCGTWNGARLC